MSTEKRRKYTHLTRRGNFIATARHIVSYHAIILCLVCVHISYAFGGTPNEKGPSTEVNVILASDGKALLPVATAKRANKIVQKHAQTLASYLERISGARFQVIVGDGLSGIAVGTAEDFPALPYSDRLAVKSPFDREAYVLHSHKSGVHVIGATDKAVEHAVWDVLYRLGYRQFFPGPAWEVIPRTLDLAITVHAEERPDYHARRIWYNWGLWGYNNVPYHQWSARNRVIRGFMLNSGHAYGAIINANRQAFQEHPEYLALVNGERKGSKLCISNPGLRQLVVEWAARKVNPDVDSISLEPSDGGGWCECALCSSMGSPSDRAVTLANAVAEAINDLGLGEKYVGMYAYNEHSPPPSVKVHPNVIISATTAFLRGGYSLNQIIEGWKDRGATLGIYDYLSVIARDWNLPRHAKAARPASVATSIQSFHQKGARFYDAESGDAWGPYGLGYYVAGRVLWDVDEANRIDEIIDDFLTKAFCSAKEPMRQFYHLITTDNMLRSGADLVGRMYRYLAEARKLAADAPEVQQRIDDLILYTRYVELYNTYALAIGDAQQQAKERVLRHAYRMRKTMMVHVYGLWARMVSQGAAHTPDHPYKSNEPFTKKDIQTILERGIAANQPVEICFKTVEFSQDLVPAAEWLNLPVVEPGHYPTVPQDRQTYYIWIDKAPAEVHLKVTVQKVWDLRPHHISLYSPKKVTVEAVDESNIVQPDGKTYNVILKTPHDGLHRIETRDGGDYTRIVWPEGMPVTLPSAINTPGVFNHFRGPWTLYFYVPKGSMVVGGWAARIANWAPRISGTLKDADGNVCFDFDTAEDGWFQASVSKGQDGRLWKFENCHGVRQLVTIPPYLARSGEELLLPREVVERDVPRH